MANELIELQLQGSTTVYKVNDARITTSAVTTATHILTTNSGVTRIAPITAANLASVLGGQATIVNNTNDANTFVTSGHYRWDSSLYLPANCPGVNAAGEIEVIAFGDLVFQTLRTNQGNVWQRAKWSTSEWTSWKAVSTDIPSFYKNYSDIAGLASALGVCSPFGAIGSLADADDISNTCMAYIWNNSTGLNPVFTYYFQKERAFQLAIIDHATIKFRYKWGGTWNAWYDLT